MVIVEIGGKVTILILSFLPSGVGVSLTGSNHSKTYENDAKKPKKRTLLWRKTLETSFSFLLCSFPICGKWTAFSMFQSEASDFLSGG